VEPHVIILASSAFAAADTGQQTLENLSTEPFWNHLAEAPLGLSDLGTVRRHRGSHPRRCRHRRGNRARRRTRRLLAQVNISDQRTRSAGGPLRLLSFASSIAQLSARS
jgi:hypothetical protein